MAAARPKLGDTLPQTAEDWKALYVETKHDLDYQRELSKQYLDSYESLSLFMDEQIQRVGDALGFQGKARKDFGINLIVEAIETLKAGAS